jgi:hypothetical protein
VFNNRQLGVDETFDITLSIRSLFDERVDVFNLSLEVGELADGDRLDLGFGLFEQHASRILALQLVDELLEQFQLFLHVHLVLFRFYNLFAGELTELVILKLKNLYFLFHFELDLAVVAAELVAHAVHHRLAHGVQLPLDLVALLDKTLSQSLRFALLRSFEQFYLGSRDILQLY